MHYKVEYYWNRLNTDLSDYVVGIVDPERVPLRNEYVRLFGSRYSVVEHEWNCAKNFTLVRVFLDLVLTEGPIDYEVKINNEARRVG